MVMQQRAAGTNVVPTAGARGAQRRRGAARGRGHGGTDLPEKCFIYQREMFSQLGNMANS